jgi:hypothetical protein
VTSMAWLNERSIKLRFICCNRSQVQGSTFRVKGKEGIKVPRCSLNS